MTEIPIQRKPRRTLWPLLILLVVVLAGSWFFWSSRVNAAATASTDSTTTNVSNGSVTLDSASTRTAPPNDTTRRP